MMAFGGAPRASIAEGRGDLKESERIMGNSFTMLMAVSVVLTVVFLVFAEPMLRIFGASDNTIGYALNYMRIYALGTIFVQVTLGMNAYITAQGFTVVGMKTVLIGAILNTVLDPIFIFAFGMGVRGAALATITAQAVSAVWVVRLFVRQAHQAADSAAASPSGCQGAGSGAGPGALTLHYAVHRESGQHRLQFLPQDLRRRPGGGRHDHLLQYHAGLFPSVSGPVPGGPAHCGL